MQTCFLGIGSNLGDRRKNIRLALEKISRLKNTKLIRLSKIIETEPLVGPSGQGKFLNAVVKINTNLTSLKLLKQLTVLFSL